jgi:hypothetical protein
MRFGRNVWTLAIVGIVFAVSFSSLVTIPEKASAYTIHDPIRIYSNSDFTAANGVTGGSGTPSDPFIIEGWEIAALGFQYGIVIRDTDAPFILRDVYVHSGDIELAGIDLDNVANATVTDSIVWGFGVCIDWGSSSNVTISNSDFSGAWHFATVGGSADNITFIGNTVTARAGNMVVFSSTNLNITGNNFTETFEGVRFSNSNNVDFTGNTILDPFSYGLVLNNSTNFNIHHNILSGKWMDYLASDDMGPENSWDDGYPSGGNYWSDYTGIDNCSGPLQNVCPDPDGIGDTPYVIDGDSQDRYPLMTPFIPPPRAPGIVWAILTGQNAQNVTVNWRLSYDDGLGFQSVVAYEVYRGISLGFDGAGYQLISTVPNGTSQIVDNLAGEGDPNNYFYRVCAVDLNNNGTCGKHQGGKYTRPLTKGVHMVSSPLVITNDLLHVVLQTVKFDTAWTMNRASKEWHYYSNTKPYHEFVIARYYAGIWVNVSEDSNFTVAGHITWASTPISLYPGWNLVSFPSFSTTYTVGDFKAQISIIKLEGYDPTAPPYYLKELSDGDLLQTGYGYWVEVGASDTWYVPSL